MAEKRFRAAEQRRRSHSNENRSRVAVLYPEQRWSQSGWPEFLNLPDYLYTHINALFQIRVALFCSALFSAMNLITLQRLAFKLLTFIKSFKIYSKLILFDAIPLYPNIPINVTVKFVEKRLTDLVLLSEIVEEYITVGKRSLKSPPSLLSED